MIKGIKIVVLSLLMLCLQNTSMAQAQRDKIEELRASFLSKKMELSTAEAEKFWPVYNELQDKLKALKRNLRLSYRNLPSNFTDKEAEELLALENKTRAAETELHKTYNEKIKSIIGAKKLVKLQIYEEEFKKEVINAIKEK
ncbi:MAG: hypothetical protein ACK50A_01710 [Sphingobacteriaceae bacterium]|jgi:hypothetical protein